jgi:magnesium transporter
MSLLLSGVKGSGAEVDRVHLAVHGNGREPGDVGARRDGAVNPAVPPEAALRETRAVLGRIEAGRLRPRSAFELSYAIVSALAQGQEVFVETVTRQVWPLEQRVTSGHLGDPEQFLEELFGTRHGLLAVSNMATLGHQIYQRMSALGRFIPPDCQPLVADLEDQFDRVAGWPTARSATWRG